MRTGLEVIALIETKKGSRKKSALLWSALGVALTMALIVFFLGVVNLWGVEITLNGEPTVTVEVGERYQDAGAAASFHGSMAFRTGWPVEVEAENPVDTAALGAYTVQYTAKKWGFTASAIRTVTVVDTQPPVLTLTENPDSYTLPGQPYQEEGYSATDNYDGDITDRVTAMEENGEVRYSVTDSSGNVATATRTIHYDDPIPPELTLLGDDEITLTAGDTFTDPGCAATDNVDGDLSANVTVSGQVNSNATGTYTLTYTVSDSYGNTVSASRTVTVEPKPQPKPQPVSGSVQTGKTIYLTFDDGPSKYTEQLLDVLDQYNVKVTFFTVNTSYADWIAEESSRGHSVGIHSATHDYADIYSSEEAYFADLNVQRQVIYDKAGIWTTLLRFPGGSSNKVSAKYSQGIMTRLVQDVTDQGYQYFDWNVSSGDAGETTDSEVVYQNVISGIQKETVAGKDSVVLQHDSKEYSVNAVEKIIQWGLENGYTFRALENGYTFRALDTGSPGAHHHINN
ncbi:MAG: polysaccharide deacetylase family protein [Oscillospiraceae bacterium]|nr:polysaccharide deacetylase family protein [Oscillospiraceae bacterium]